MVTLEGVALAPPAVARAYTSCMYAAHRGLTAHATENSLRAFKAALAQHANYLEMDVQVTKDGVFTLMHDETIDRTSGGRGRVINKTWAQLRRIRLNDGEHVPSLSSVLDMTEPTRANVLLELKWIPESRFDQLKRRIDKFGTERVVVHSFNFAAVRRFHTRFHEIKTAVDTHHRISVAEAGAYGGVLPDYRRVPMTWLANLRAREVPAYLFTVNSPHAWRRFEGRSTVVITDRASAYQRWRSHACA
jgi:glycerophosphoryl diester phosphodiesterase